MAERLNIFSPPSAVLGEGFKADGIYLADEAEVVSAEKIDPVLALGAVLREIQARARECNLNITTHPALAKSMKLMMNENLSEAQVSEIENLFESLRDFIKAKINTPTGDYRNEGTNISEKITLGSIVVSQTVGQEPVLGKVFDIGADTISIRQYGAEAREMVVSKSESQILSAESIKILFPKGKQVYIPRGDEQKNATPVTLEEIALSGADAVALAWLVDGIRREKIVPLSKITIVTSENSEGEEKTEQFQVKNTIDTSLESQVGMYAELEILVTNPFTLENSSTYDLYIRNVLPKISSAIQAAEYVPFLKVDAFIKSTFDKINFTQTPEKITDDINRLIKNILIQTKLRPKHPVATTVTTNLTAIPEYAQVEPWVVADSGKITSDTVVAIVEPISSTDNAEAILVLESTPQTDESIKNKSEYREALEKLTTEAIFNRESYVNYANTVHTRLRRRYDDVLTSARANLKRYSTVYTPSKTEKEALQFLSSLQGQYARMQKAGSEIGIVRAELMNSLNYTDNITSELVVKASAEHYLTEAEKLLTNIDKLEHLIEVAELEEQPHLAEAYRAQFESMRVEGNQVLSTLSTDHSYYSAFKHMIEDEVSELIKSAAVENGGDKYVTQSFEFVSLKRNRIKAATAYFKAEQEHQDFKARQLEKVQAVEVLARGVTETLPEKALELQKQISVNTENIKNTLEVAGTLPEGVELSRLAEVTLQDAATDFVTQKELVKALLRETSEIVEEFKKYTAPTVVNETKTAPNTNIEAALPPLVLGTMQRLATRTSGLQKQIPESIVPRGRLSKILAQITPKRVGYLAAIVAGLAIFSDTRNSPEELKSAAVNPFFGMGSLAQPTNEGQIDRAGIEAYLKAIAPDSLGASFKLKEPISEAVLPPELKPTVPSYQPMPMQNELEVAPGVTLHVGKGEAPSQAQVPELKIFGEADEVPADPGVTFFPTEKIEGFVQTKNELYKISYGDVFWDIAEGQSLAGNLPVMKQINPYFKQSLIDRLRDRLNSSKEFREKIGGFGNTADDLITGGDMNMLELNKEAVLLAINYGYLQ